VLDCELAGSLKLKRAYALETESRKVSDLA
jgi:hypothetical protein